LESLILAQDKRWRGA